MNNSNKNTRKFGRFSDLEFSLWRIFYSKVRGLTNFKHAGVFQMSTIVNLGIGFQFKSSSLLEGDVKVRKCHDMLFVRNCMSRKWMRCDH